LEIEDWQIEGIDRIGTLKGRPNCSRAFNISIIAAVCQCADVLEVSIANLQFVDHLTPQNGGPAAV
jgi:hypothetical protein